MKSKYLVESLLWLSLVTTMQVACAPAPPPVAPVVEIPVEPPGDDADAAARRPSCGTACTNLRGLGCALGKPTPRGANCETVCNNVQVQNAGAGFPVACLSAARSCSIADACR